MHQSKEQEFRENQYPLEFSRKIVTTGEENRKITLDTARAQLLEPERLGRHELELDSVVSKKVGPEVLVSWPGILRNYFNGLLPFGNIH